MEKLIELLNEYEKKTVVHWYEWYCQGNLMCRYIKDNFEFYTDEATTIAISKYYGFIKWLVDNDKIDKEKVIKADSKYYGFIKWLVDNDKIDKEKVIKAETLPILDINEDYVLMLLAIQDNPIDVLISILK